MSMLGSTWQLGDVRDVEAMCGAVLDRYCRRNGLDLDPTAREEKTADLLAWTWKLWRFHFDPSRQPSFASYASWKLGCLLHDDTRQRFGRNGDRREIELPSSLNDLDELRLERAFAPGPGDSVDDRALASAGLSPNGDREDLLRACADVARIARTPKGVARLMKQLREELEAQAAA